MLIPEPKPLHLRRIDPTRNMRRFYMLSIQPPLFGGASLVRNWGRIGTNGKVMVQTFDDSAEASEAFGRLERAKGKRGYVMVQARLPSVRDHT
ncbi:WGR domain-containing protein [Bradyrhizobium sp. 142]|uniref:WGR domain-containing protein n=1 Tax=Bradyrhizobium sp. 142 TaxID=2782618 RepID=UPI001FFB6B75|nr:WGR domain-containing protein [Bradyrhizobium sp. 142]MCK1724970.1 WGR domain-containing protein [Bradyrhizobium sp. 142]